MRKLSILLLFVFSFVQVSMAQRMSDEQIMQYVIEAQASGMSQQDMMSALMKKGVTVEQLKNLQSKYSKSSQGASSKGVISGMLNNPERMRETTDDPEERMIKGEKSKGSLKASGKSSGMGGGMSTMRGMSSMSAMGGFSTMDEDGMYPYDEDMYMMMFPKDRTTEVFGRDLFNNKKLTFEPNLNIATPENYRLGPGDEVLIDIWGGSQTTICETISPDGNIQIENYGPLYLNGMTVKEANDYATSELSKIYTGIVNNTSRIKLTLGQIRSIQVNVMGEVKVPGSYTLSSLASVFHALYMAGGVSDIGTLRAVKVYRDNKLVSTIDIYDYIINGVMKDNIRLMDGDVIVVGPYDSVVKVAGKVKRPMFYEMKNSESVATLLKYAGGFTGDAYSKNIRLIRKSGREHQIYNVEEFDFNLFKVMDGDSVFVDSVLTRFANMVEVKGAVYRPGMYQMGGSINTVKELIEKAEGIRGDAFLNRAVLHRRKEDLTLEVISLDVNGLLNGTTPDIALRKDDVLFIPSIHDMQEGRTLTISGEVAKPGVFPYADNITLEDLVLQAGGLKEAASTVRIDVARRVKDPKATKPSNEIAQTFSFSLKDGFVVDGETGFALEPFDEVYVRRSPGYQQQQNVAIEGEVLFGGTYALTKKNQRLSELVERAGGFTKEAYIKGARLERKMTPEEKVRLEAALKMARTQAGNESMSAETLDLGDVYSVGIELEKALDKPGSDADIVLREGDKLVVPEYNNTVKIGGAVMHPNTVAYNPDQKTKYYVNMAGGYSYRAKKSRAYVIYMNGTVARLKGKSKKAIQPGCEIIVPRKAGNKASLAEIIGMASTSATTLAALAALIK